MIFDAREIDVCPEHAADIRGEYTFGQEDADVVTYECGCAACINRTSGFGDVAVLYPSYAAALGAARLVVAREQVFAARHGF